MPSEAIRQASTLGNVVVMPDFNLERVPVKETWRCMLQELWNSFGELDCRIYLGFCLSNKRNPTVDWFQALEHHPKRLLMGGDSFTTLHRWKDAEELINLIDELLVLPRLETREEFDQQKQRLIDISRFKNYRIKGSPLSSSQLFSAIEEKSLRLLTLISELTSIVTKTLE